MEARDLALEEAEAEEVRAGAEESIAPAACGMPANRMAGAEDWEEAEPEQVRAPGDPVAAEADSVEAQG